MSSGGELKSSLPIAELLRRRQKKQHQPQSQPPDSCPDENTHEKGSKGTGGSGKNIDDEIKRLEAELAE
jgi:hypothetical protein